MAERGPIDLIMFIAGEPDSGRPSLRQSTVSSLARAVGAAVPLGLVMKSSQGPTTVSGTSPSQSYRGTRWHLPPEQVHCINTVLEVAEQEDRKVAVVDVDRSDGRQDLVARWVGPDDVLPLLVRPDGARLQGIENFSPRTVRRFVRRP
jgi:hypothetical protein